MQAPSSGSPIFSVFVAVLLLLSAGSSADAQTTALFLDSRDFDFVGFGFKGTLTPAAAEVNARRLTPSLISFTLPGSSPVYSWTLEFGGDGAVPRPAVGSYFGARAFSYTTGNTLSVRGEGRSCSTSTGRFVVLEAEYSGDEIVRFAADFEQHCGDGLPALFGALRYNSTVSSMAPFGGAYPVISLTVVPPAHGRVQGVGLDCGTGSTSCSVSPVAGTTFQLSASPDPGYVFGGWNLDCSGDSTTSVHVNSAKTCAAIFLPLTPDAPRTFAVLTGGPGSSHTRGGNIILSSANSRWVLQSLQYYEVRIMYTGPRDEQYYFAFFAPPFGHSFAAGQQWIATRVGSATEARFDLFGGDPGCGSSTTKLSIREWDWTLAAPPQRFLIDFEMQCSPSGVVTGTIGYNTEMSVPSLEFDRNTLTLGIARIASTVTARSADQVVQIRQAGGGTASWQLITEQSWLSVTPTSGTGSGTVTIRVRDGAPLPPEPGPWSARIKLLARGALAVPEPILVSVNVVNGETTAPFGTVDTPLDGATRVRGSIGVTGWAMDDVGIAGLRLYRAPVAPEPAGQLVFIGYPVRVEGARPDIAAAFPHLPMNSAAGWGYMLLTNMLPNGGDGTFTLHVYADDAEGRSTLLGMRTIVCENGTATLPFGAIDTPQQGEVVSGLVNNFGWVLSPGNRRADPPSGGTVRVYIDGLPVGMPGGWTSRPDLTGLFPQAHYAGIGSALGVFSFDTTTLANGTHTIAWGVVDDVGGSAGVGSRYFTVFNGAAATTEPDPPISAATMRSAAAVAVPPAIEGRLGFDDGAPWREFGPDSAGVITVQAEELGRIQLRLEARRGRLINGTRATSLPIGAVIEGDGTFTWQPGVAYLGAYELAFETPRGVVLVTIVVNPRGSSRNAGR